MLSNISDDRPVDRSIAPVTAPPAPSHPRKYLYIHTHTIYPLVYVYAFCALCLVQSLLFSLALIFLPSNFASCFVWCSAFPATQFSDMPTCRLRALPLSTPAAASPMRATCYAVVVHLVAEFCPPSFCPPALLFASFGVRPSQPHNFPPSNSFSRCCRYSCGRCMGASGLANAGTGGE
jgi:hypothetical protein